MPDNFHPANAANPFADYSEKQLYEFLASYDVPRDPGVSGVYLNLGLGLLGLTANDPLKLLAAAMDRTRSALTPAFEALLLAQRPTGARFNEAALGVGSPG